MELGQAERIGRVIEIQGRHPVHWNARIQLRVRGAREDLHMMAQGQESAAQMIEVNPLTATVGVAAVGEKANAKRSVHIHPDSGSLQRTARMMPVMTRPMHCSTVRKQAGRVAP